MTRTLYSISISARATLDMHSLNNEGGEGNQIQTRMVNIVDQSGQLQNVNAISGDMYKHIQAEHLFRLLREDKHVPLCAGCREFNANRINADPDFIAEHPKDVSDADTIDDMLRACAMDDIEGILITAGNRSTPRKSVVEFGWVVGVPEAVTTDSYFHVKYANERSAEKRAQDREATQKSGANLQQAIFHRPASSGIYAVVCHLELARIGFNDITQQYVIDLDQRQRRMRALLESVLYTFLQPRGAMRSAQAPHLVDFQGVLTFSERPVPAPTVSPLHADYREHIADLVEVLGGMGSAVEGVAFGSLGDFAGVIGDLTEAEPYTVQYT